MIIKKKKKKNLEYVESQLDHMLTKNKVERMFINMINYFTIVSGFVLFLSIVNNTAE